MANQFALEIVTPENIFYNDQVEMVIMRTTSDRAILKDHIPFVAGLVEGQLRVKKDGKFKEGKISGGFITVTKEKTTILTEAASWDGEVSKETI